MLTIPSKRLGGKMDKIDFIPEYWTRWGLDHTSPTQSNKSNGIWAAQYLICTNEERRKFTTKPVMTAGNALQRGIDTCIVDRLDPKTAADEAVYQYTETAKATWELDDEYKIQYNAIKDGMPQMVANGIAALKEIFPKYDKIKIKSERPTSCEVPGLEIPMVGYIDYESKDVVVELKTKQRKRPKYNKDGTAVCYSGTLPKQPEIAHVKQVGFYKQATNKQVFLVYVNDKEPGYNKRTKTDELGYVIFDQTHDMLNDESFDFYWENYRVTNIVRQNILKNNSELKDILSNIDPEFHSGFWDYGDEYVARAKKLWGEV
tara:strand:- start:2865 stop:3815 length:951 start_codon:yes stop_codon:yes gene_type:complete